MTTSFRQVSLRYFRTQKLRTAITVGGIALGVATMVSIRLLAEAMPGAYERMIDRIAGRAELRLDNGEAGVPEMLLAEVRQTEGVELAVATIHRFVSLPSMPGEFLSVFGVDLLEDGDVREYDGIAVEEEEGDPLVFLAEPDSIALTTTFLAEHDLELGDRITVAAPVGHRELVIRSRLGVRSGPATLFGGRFAVMDLYAAQALFDLDGRFTSIDVIPKEGSSIAELRANLSRVADGRAMVESPAARGETMGRLLAGQRYASTLSAMLAMGVGLYLIFNTMMVAVVQRRREIGILRSIGMTRAGVIRLVVAESLFLGLLGCVLGVPLGFALAYGLAPVMSADLFRTYYLSFDAPDLSLRLGPILWGSGIALLNAVLAAVLPARDAARIPPVEALRRVPTTAEPTADPYRRLALWGIAAAALSFPLWRLREAIPIDPPLLAAACMMVRWIGVASTVPWLVRFAIRCSERPLAGLLGFQGAVASRNLVRHLDRVAVTSLAFFVSLAGAVAIATQVSSFQHTIQRSMDLWFSTADLVVFSPGASGMLPAEIARVSGVERVGVVRSQKVAYEGSLIAVAARGAEPSNTPTRLASLGHVEILDGDRVEVLNRFVRGEGAIVNEAFVMRFERKAGDVITLPTPTGEARLPILGTYWDASFSNLGIVLIDREIYQELWKDDQVNLIEPRLAPSGDRDAIADTIRRNWGGDHPLFVYTLDGYRQEVETAIARSFTIPAAMVAIAFAIAILGVVNSLLASVLDRVREIGVLRAIGATRGQVAGSILIEAAVVGVVGAALAGTIGAALGYVDLGMVYGGILPLTVLYRFPTGGMIFGCLGGVLAAALAGFLPGRQAARLKPTEALQYE